MHSVRRRVVAPITLVVGGGLLAACGGSGTATGTMTGGTAGASTSATTSASAGSSTAPSGTTSTSLDPTAPVTAGDPKAALTPPGTKLKLGEPATLVAESGKKGDKYYTKAIYKVIVTEVRQGATSDFAQFKNKDEFAGLTPWYIESTNEIVYWEGSQYGHPTLTLSGIRADGTKAGWVTAFGGFEQCKSTSFKTRDVGEKEKPCTIAATKGEAVTGARYDGDTSSDYYKAPVVWSK